MKSYRVVENLPLLPHHFAAGVKIKPLITKEEHELDLTCVLVEVPAGIDVPFVPNSAWVATVDLLARLRVDPVISPI